MRLLKKITLFVFLLESLCFVPQKLFAQNENLYKNLHSLQQSKEDTNKINLLVDIAWDYAYFKYDSGKYYSRQAIRLSKKLNSENGEAQALNIYGNCCRGLLQFDSAMLYYNKGLVIREKQKNLRQKAGVLQNMANVYNAQHKHPEAIQKYKEALKFARESKYDQGALVIVTNMTGVYQLMGDNDKALNYAREALEINKRVKDTLQYCYIYSNMALILQGQKQYDKSIEYNSTGLKYARLANDKSTEGSILFNMGTVCKEQKKYSEAEKYYLQSIDVFAQLGDSISIGMNLHNLGNLYNDQGRIDEAAAYQQKAMGIFERGGDSTLIGQAMLAIAQVYSNKGKMKEALSLGQKSLILAQKLGEIELLKNGYRGMSDMFQKAGDYKNAIVYLERSYAISDSLFNKEIAMKNGFMQAELELSTKENQIELLNKTDELRKAELQRKAVFQYFLIGIIVLALGFLVFAFVAYKNKKKDNKIILAQKAEVEQQNHVIEEKNKEILDSIHYARRIQRALLASNKLLNTHLVQADKNRDYFVLYKPKDIVSGDFYWASEVKKLREGKMVFGKGQPMNPENKEAVSKSLFALVTADCTGHGVPGAFMSLLNISLLNEAVNEKKINRPDLVLNTVRTNIIQALSTDGSQEGGKDGMDAVFCLFDFEAMKLQYAAANNGLYIVRNKELIDLKPDKMPVGKHDLDQKPFTLSEFELMPGDTVYTYTDGYADQFGGPKGKKFMYKQMQTILLANSDTSMNDQKEILNTSIESWKGSLEQVDDILIIGVRV